MKNERIDFTPALLLNHFKVTLRKIQRQKGYTLINVSGLAVGLACCAIILLWVRNEKSFDSFHANRDSIYRLIKETRTNVKETQGSWLEEDKWCTEEGDNWTVPW